MSDIRDFAHDMLVALGEAEDGELSLRELVEQSAQDEPEEEVSWGTTVTRQPRRSRLRTMFRLAP